jgi:hypothetical protein
MARLVKNTGDEIHVAQGRIYNADFGLIYVADVDANTQLPQGWTYFEGDVEVEDFVQSWKQPEGAHDAYPLGAVVTHNNQEWRSIIAANVWAPGVTGWQLVADGAIPAWMQPAGAHDAYSKDALVMFEGEGWVSEIDANVWAPGTYGWRRTLIEPPPVYDPNVVPDWVQPLGSEDAYQIGDRVTHNGQIWVSTHANNVWEPGVFGWDVE